jgi:hypothetical protein
MNTTTTYLFDELPTAELKAAAIKDFRDWSEVSDDWAEHVLDDWKEKLESLGYSDPEIQYSGFWTQGDGASFTCKQVPLPDKDPAVIKAWEELCLAAGLIGEPISEDIADLAHGGVYRTCHRSCHENTVSIDWEWNDPPYIDCPTPEGLEPFIEALKADVETYFENLEDTVKDLCRQIYSDLEDEYEYLTSDEAIAERLEANEVEFEVDEEGRLVS